VAAGKDEGRAAQMLDKDAGDRRAWDRFVGGKKGSTRGDQGIN
jgi:hypothetical protein